MFRHAFSVFLTVLLLWSGAALAQQAPETPQIDYNAWNQFAEQAEDTVAAGTATNAELADLRARLVEWREQFAAGQNLNASRIATVRDQIEALGPAPAEGATEDEEIATRRTTLNTQLSELQAPRVAANEAYSRADAIVRSIDTLSALRQAGELARASPSPLNPVNWPDAWSETVRLVTTIASDMQARAQARGGWGNFQGNLPNVLGYLIAAVILLGAGRRWIDSLPSRLSAQTSVHSRAVIGFVVSLGQIAIPLIGIVLGIAALNATGIFGDYTTPILQSVPMAGMILFGGRWIVRQAFSHTPIAYATLTLPDKERDAVRVTATILATLTALHHIAASSILPLSGFNDGSEASGRIPFEIDESAAGVLHFILILPAALLLFRLGNILRNLVMWDGTEQPPYRARILTMAGGLSRLIAVVAVVAAAAGLITGANALLWPWIISLALICLLILLQDFSADLFEMFTRGREGARDGLGPVLIGFALILLSTPIFALIWGARRSDLSEWWTRIGQGVSLGGISLSPGAVLTFLIVFAIGYSGTRFVQGVFRNTILPKTRLDAGGQNAMVSGIGYIGIFLAALLAITSAGIDLSSLAIVAGALSVGVGFGMQNIVSNFVSGIILLIERPISVGDWISVGNDQGIVRRISVRSTEVETFDRTQVIVPNSNLISQPVTNWTRGSQAGRIIIPIGVGYNSDTRKVAAILREIIEDQPTVTIDPPPAVVLRSLGADSLNFEIRAILSDVSGGVGVTSEVLHQVVARFAKEGIEIPFAQRDIWLRNPETLTGAITGTGQAAATPEAPKPPPAPEDAPAAEPQVIDPRLDDPPLTGDGESAGDGSEGR
ncbi:MAG: DUF3772 domain-containing protein [Paracoccus sp. (in: a-proteobacteria)]|uniref:DUF3772 domain-containing protein n=1 Tax=Paracoccus sp. TaxID=267 RepID=UPI0026DF6DCA|nr:DUF3772 domain-containing protein [Paracoccus sp. (in: a-proteobacteria)]MDO5631559.1 DUF3772 domain-containing protein [Paracoccus sp. (in: a-proteobacteria)]